MRSTFALDFKKNHSVWLFLLLIATLWGAASLWFRPDLNLIDQFLFSDFGFDLLYPHQILAGKMLYRDIFCPYGPLPTYLFTGVAALFGDTPQTYCEFAWFFTLLDVVLIYFVLRRALSSLRLILFVLFAIFPVFLQPGAFTNNYWAASYISIERTLLVCAVLCWKPQGQRTKKRAYVIGIILGAMQWTRFGPACVMGAAICIVDIAFFTPCRYDEGECSGVDQNLPLYLGGLPFA